MSRGAVCLIAMFLSACGSSSGSADSDDRVAGRDKTGIESADGPVVLRAAMQGGEGRPRAQVIERFAEEVERASGGALTLEITYGNNDSYQHFLDGDFDVLLANARSLDSMGVSTFDVLTMPFLVQDDEQADRVAQADVVDDMMAGLGAIDATGLVFAPVYEEHLAVAGEEPLRRLDQLHTGIRTDPPSDRLAMLFDAFGGAARRGLNDEGWQEAVDSGDALASEFPLALATLIPQPSAMAANFAIFYEFGVVLIRNEALDELSDDQRANLVSAAAVAEQRSIDERTREDDAFRDACVNGATLTAMPYSMMAAIGDVVDDVILQALEEPQTDEIYHAVRRAAGARTWEWPSECRDGEITEYTPPDPPATTFPEGVYRIRGRLRDQMLVSGVSNDEATNNDSSYFELTFADGEATYVLHALPGDEDVTCSIDYTVDGDGHLVVPDGCGWEGTYTWSRADGQLVLEALPVHDLLHLSLDFDNSALGWSALVPVG